jgi:hypothetical protein
MENDNQFLIQPEGSVGISIAAETFEQVEWVFQFNEDEPIRFAEAIDGTKEMTLTVSNHSNISFHDDKGNKFKIFAREKR